MKDKNTNETSAPVPSARTQEHRRRLPVGGLNETDSRRGANTEYVMRMLVSGRAPLEEAPSPSGPSRPKPPSAAAPEPSRPEPPPPPAPDPPPGAMTLENLTFDDLLAELQNL